MRLLSQIRATAAPASIILIRALVGCVFLSEGIQKFLFPAEIGAGRFAKTSLPSPEFLASFVGVFEIGGGVLVLLGFFTRLAVIPLIIVILVAIFSTKIPILFESGFWKMAHESRTDFAMLLASIFLLINGAGQWSLDASFNRNES